LVIDVVSESTEPALDELLDHESFWNKLEVEIKEILAEVDSMAALVSKSEQPPIVQRQAGILRQTGISERRRISSMAAAELCSDSEESAVLRKPQNQDEYWSISPSAWLHTSKPRQMVLSHVGRINETTEGEQALDGDCTACARTGAECMVYRDKVSILCDDRSGRACSRCRFRGSKCSFDTITNPGKSKRKRATGDDLGCKGTKKTSSRRKLRGSDMFQ
jgi:hypothetical protein